MATGSQVITVLVILGVAGFFLAPKSNDVSHAPAIVPQKPKPVSSEDKLRIIDRYYMLAFNASICQLRSSNWFVVMKQGWQSTNEQIIYSEGISYQKANQIMEDIKAEVAQDFGTFPGICQRLPNTMLMDTLDDIERRFTGNYH